MPSKARKAFDANADDIRRLLDIHSDLGGDARGRRYRLEVLNKSAVVLLTAIWEAYCEDIASEALEHIVANVPDSKALPKELKKLIAKELKGNLNDLAMWDLSDDGWRTLLENRLSDLKEDRNRKLNTPKTSNINDLFFTAIGLSDISLNWKWGRTKPDQAKHKLDKYVTLRGEIAHRGQALKGCSKKDVGRYFSLILNLVPKTGVQLIFIVQKLHASAFFKPHNNRLKLTAHLTKILSARSLA